MALYNFPDSPSNADTVTINGITYTYNSTKAYWTSSAGSSGSGGASVSTSDSAPSSPSDGDLWYDTDDGGMFVYYADGSSNQWVEVVGQQGAAGAAGADGSATVVANVTALLALSSPAAGDQAFVTATNTLYFYNGSGWYKIALINTNPSISGASATYDLAIDGTATTVTIVATDPEGIPITYSIASDTSGSVATVAQGTGASTNVWTITPSTNNAHAGTFSLTFRASDGVNIATAASSFTLEFTVVNSHYTTALITSVGANNKVNSSDFTDQASTPIAWTNPSSRATQTTFSPYRHGGYSVYCDGNDAVKFNETSANEFTFGTGDFTMEGWFWLDLASIAASGEHTLIGNNGTDGQMWFSVIGSTWSGPKYNFQTGTSGWANTIASGANTVKLRQWVHLAVVRISGTVNIYENGVSVANGSNTINIPNTNNMLSFMGRPQTYGQYAPGYIHDVRITKGTGVYTSGFTPPTEKMEAVTNTKLLAFRKPYIVDESASPLSSTVDTGDPSIEPFAPYDYSSYSASLNAGSLVAPSATLASLEISNSSSAALELGNSDFAMECWLYRTGASPTAWGMVYVGGDGSHTITTTTNDIPQFAYTNSSGSGWQNWLSSTDVAPLNRWTHILVTRDSNTLRIFRDGVLKNSASYTDSIKNTSNSKYLGGGYTQTQTLPSYLADFRIIKGSVPSGYQTSSTTVGTGVFTPPTAPLSNVTDTVTLMQFNEAAIIDKSQTAKTITLNGNVKSSTTQTKYLTSSMYFDGTGDYILLDDNGDLHDMFAADFTIEGWYYPSTTPASSVTAVFSKRANGSTTGGVLLYFAGADTTPSLLVDTGGSWGINSACSSGFTVGQWNHFAVTRNGSAFKVFIDGSSVLSVSSSATIPNNTAKFGIGTMGNDGSYAMPAAYFSDIRITKGLARYTSNFTTPTAALKG